MLRDSRPPYTHDLQLLLDLLEETGEEVDDLASLVDYTVSGTTFRYWSDQSFVIDRTDAASATERLYTRVSTLHASKSDWPDEA